MKTIRLLETFKPANYKIHIVLDESMKRFSTTSTITGVLQQATSTISLHSKSLEIETIALLADGKEVDVDHSLEQGSQTIELSIKEKLSEGTDIEIVSTVSAEITPSMHGIYPANYEENGEQKTIISTQFESHHAREVFPCIDEPAAKATFDLTLTSLRNHTVVANTPIKSQKSSDKLQTIQFETTPIMSSYLLAFASGDLARVQDKTMTGVEVSIYSTLQSQDKLDFALDIATRCLEFYEEYFGIAYPLAKCDHIAIPEFASGAMENWGCITYRETALLSDPESTSLASKQYIASVIAHELAHQWFGNLVTMSWWDDLWLNEGFATWVSYLAVDALHPEWKFWDQFVIDDFARAMSLDALESSHPIRVPVNDPREINEIFDAVSYSKGSSVIRMLNNYIGADTFKNGLQKYLQKHQYGNATTDDLWSSLSGEASIDVGKFMMVWTEKTGYPVVDVTQLDDSHAELSQSRFTLHPNASSVDYFWDIPLFTDNDSSKILSDGTKKISLPDVQNGLNKGRSGLYRVAYSTAIAQSLGKQIENGDLDVVDRLGLVDDAFSAARAGNQQSVDAIKLAKSYSNELDPNVLDELASDFGIINAIMYPSSREAEQAMSDYVSSIINHAYEHYHWQQSPDEDANTSLARQSALSLAVTYDCGDARQQADNLFTKFRTDDAKINPNFRSLVYSNAVRLHESQELYDWFVKQHNTETLQEEKLRFAASLLSFQGETFAKQNIQMMMSAEVRQQDIISWLARLLGSRASRSIAWEWYKENWEWLKAKFKDGHTYNYLVLVLAALSTLEQAQEISNFFKDKDTNGIDMSLAQSLEKIETNAQWRKRDQDTVQQFFKQ